MITQELVKELFDYRDGVLFWRMRVAHNIQIGDRAGCNLDTGYRTVQIKRKPCREHRVIFLWHYGYLPQYIDHINGVKNDNRIENLRPCTKSQNGLNSKKRTTNKSGFKGVSWCKVRRKWRVLVRDEGKQKTIGFFVCLEEAALASQRAAKELHGDFARHA